jgi:hypothetical protein
MPRSHLRSKNLFPSKGRGGGKSLLFPSTGIVRERSARWPRVFTTGSYQLNELSLGKSKDGSTPTSKEPKKDTKED